MNTSPHRLGKYELQQRLGRGGMAEVWKAFDTQLQRYVAIKLLHAKLQADANFTTQFLHEAQLVASLHHPNIIQIHDFQVSNLPENDGPVAYMVMDYVEGQTLADYIRTTSARGQIPSPAEIVQIFTSLSLAIDYAHQKGMIHRDIKPANILLDSRNTTRNSMGEPILTDFGFAKLLGLSTSGLSGSHIGTPLYLSPEQARGLPASERSDLYSLGVILYEMVTGTTPFHGDTPIAVITQHLGSMPTLPALINPRIPPALTAVIMRSLAKDPNARFPTASAMVRALAEAVNIAVPATLVQTVFPMNPTNAPPLLSSRTSNPSLPAIPAAASLEGPTQQVLSQSLPPRMPMQASQPYPAVTPATQLASSGSPGAGSTFIPTAPVYPPLAPTPLGPVFVPTPLPGRRRQRLLLLLIVLLIIVVIGAGVGAYFVLLGNGSTNNIASGTVVGAAFFVSSGQLKPESAQGIADQLEIDLKNIADPQPGKSYYAWLLGDIHPSREAQPLELPLLVSPPILLTKLAVNHGNAHFFYKGDAQHDNLFSVTSRFLITEEDAHSTPKSPSTDHSTWRYYAEIPQTPYGPNHLSALDHIRHLFYKETKILTVLGLPGGLDIWLLRDTEKVWEWSISARDDWHGPNTTLANTTLMRNLFISMLDYLDGAPNVHIDVPPNTPVLADPMAAQVALLKVDASQGVNALKNPPDYLDHVQLHLGGVVGAPDATPRMRLLAGQIVQALHNATIWLKQVRKDAQQLVKLNSSQLMQDSTQTLLDDLVTQATYAYIGQIDPATNRVQPGILEAHYEIQQLATFIVVKM